jgi:hypothetical protein
LQYGHTKKEEDDDEEEDKLIQMIKRSSIHIVAALINFINI